MQEPCAHPTRFPNLLGLSALPWFEIRDGRIALRRTSEIGPIADVHTHFALGYLGRPRVDLEKEHPRTEYYLPAANAIDLELYANQNMSAEDIKRLTRDLVWRAATGGGMRATHTAPNLERDMAASGVTVSMLLPIDLPFISRNAETWIEIAGRRPGLFSLGSVHPYQPGAAARLARQKAAGARGIKLHPNVQVVAPDNDRMIQLARVSGELALPVLIHAGPAGIEPEGGRRRSQMTRYERMIRECPGTKFVLGHAGALQPEVALALARKYDNVWLEIASQSLGVVRTLAREAPSDRWMHGSDWPFYHPAISVAKVLIATDADAGMRRRALWNNAAALFGLEAPA